MRDMNTREVWMASMEAPSIGDKVLSLEVSPNLLLQLGQVTSHFRICFHIWKKKMEIILFLLSF